MCSTASTVEPSPSRTAQSRRNVSKRFLNGRRVHEPVAGARLGEQIARARRVRLDLPAQVRDVDVEVVRLDLVGGPPHLAQEHAMREQLALALREHAEEV